MGGIFTVFFVVVGVVAAISQPLSGLFYDKAIVFFGVYLLRESWLLPAILAAIGMLQWDRRQNQKSVYGFLPTVVFFSSAIFLVLILLNDRTPSLMIVFLQFRNIFGFALALIAAVYFSRKVSPGAMRSISVGLALFAILYCYAELYVWLSKGYLISNEWFNKELLESAKGTRADVFGGIFGDRRIPGPLFNPSQMGMYAVYMMVVLSLSRVKFGLLLQVLLLGVVMMGVSKSAIAMVFFLLVLRIGGRSLGLIAVVLFAFLPFALDLLEGALPNYHLASITRHFEGYTAAVHAMAESPLGTGVGSAGELASTLGGFEAKIGFESGMGTILSNLGVLGIVYYIAVMIFAYRQTEPVYFTFFALWSVSMFFNESALSPHLFIFQLMAAAAIATASAKRISKPLSVQRTTALAAH